MPERPATGSAAALAQALRARELSPQEAAAAALEHVARRDGAINAFVRLDAGDVEAQAAAAAQAPADAPLRGVPVSLKDVFDVAGVPTSAGSRVLDALPARLDSTVARRLRDAGAVLFGKVGLHELCYGCSGLNEHFGPVRNPWDATRIAGGSSSGSAAAVAAGMGFASVGTDTGGSVRVPAALCGATGFKPTFGAISRSGCFPLSGSLDHVGVVGATVADCALLHAVLSGTPLAAPGELPVGLRVGLPRAAVARTEHAPALAALERARTALEALGARVSELELPEEDEAVEAARVLVQWEAAAIHRPLLATRAERYGTRVRARLEAALTVTAEQATAARTRWQRACARLLARQRDLDVVLSPTVPIQAPAIATMEGDDAVAVALERRLLANAYLFNATGQPAISLPAGRDDDGLPLAVQLAAGPGREALLLAVARRVEAALGDVAARVALTA